MNSYHSEKEDATLKKIETLQKIVTNVYLPWLGDKPEIRMHLEKFVKQISNTKQQAYGNVTIEIPEIPHKSMDEMRNDEKLKNIIDKTVEGWAHQIHKTIEQENNKTPDGNTALDEIEYWRSRSAKFNTLYQQLALPQVKDIIALNEELNQQVNSKEEFKNEMKSFTKAHAQAKDYVKFLSTLDRQLRNISKGDLNVIEETITSLLNGLKLVWTISRHINNNPEKMMELIMSLTNEICDKVKSKVSLREIFDMPPDKAISIIEIGRKVLERWESQYTITRNEIEQEGSGVNSRWEFNHGQLFNRPRYMRGILQQIKEACTTRKEFITLLGPDLKAITGDSGKIDNISDEVNEHVNKLKDFTFDVFVEEYKDSWDSQFKDFKNSVQQIESKTISMIDETFSSELKSSEGAFTLLLKFKDIRTRDEIEKKLDDKYDEVLGQYEKELHEMEQLFIHGKDNPPIPKNTPPVAGAITWARSIFGRIKAPIDQFKQKEDLLKSHKGVEITNSYIALCKKLDAEYENEKYNSWIKENNEKAIKLLRNMILVNKHETKQVKTKKKAGIGADKEPKDTRKDDIDRNYQVNFSPELKVIIREAQYLDKLGKSIPQTIINIALQENNYIHHVDKLDQLLREYKMAIADLKDVEKSLLQQQICEMNIYMDKGCNNHNWFSLSIREYIKDCKDAINRFNETKARVKQQAQNIEKNVQKIKNAKMIRDIPWKSIQPMGIVNFSEYFDSHRKKVLEELVINYQNIGDIYLKNVEETTVKTNTRGSPYLARYYKYWETRIFNAISVMILRAMASVKTIFSGKIQKKPLIIIEGSYNNQEISYHPSKEELANQLEKFIRNILESAKKFGRWWKGYCIIFEKATKGDASEDTIPFTFFDDVNESPIITDISAKIIQAKEDILKKINSSGNHWKKIIEEKKLWNKNEENKLRKDLEKNPITNNFEWRLSGYSRMYKDLESKPSHNFSYFIIIDFAKVRRACLDKNKEWMKILGDKLKQIAINNLNQITDEIEENHKLLKVNLGHHETLAVLLSNINRIKDMSMDMEFRILDVQEQFRILENYMFDIEPELKKRADNLGNEWNNLIYQAKKTDYDSNQTKETLANITEKEVEQFSDEIKKVYERYVEEGPGSDEVTLDKGVELLDASKEQVLQFNKIREQKVRAQKLFGLPISKYDELIKMEELNKKYDLIYNIYKEFQTNVKEWSQKAWNKLDIKELISGVTELDKNVKKLTKKSAGIEQLPPYSKLKKTVTGFKESVPLIERLKVPAIQKRHWEKIIGQTGRDFGEFDLKSINLAKVFELELQNYQEVVETIVKEAEEEEKNENNLKLIEQTWKTQQFTVVPYTKGNENRGWAIKVSDEIRELLEDNIMKLQNIGSSKLARAFTKDIKKWEKNLNLINDVIDIFLIVQRKWMYLESIFNGSEDIRQQLNEEAKKFDKINNQYKKKIMENVAKKPNVLSVCVGSGDSSMLNELRNISMGLDKCQKSLTNYLESKRNSFARFYFISSEELLSILGSSDPQKVQPHLLKLFDNCKSLNFAKGGKVISGMTSDENESFDFEVPQKPEGAVEDWMTRVDDEMKATLHVIAKRGIMFYAKEKRTKWITEQLGMITVVGSQVWWTFAVEDVFKRVAEGDKHAMKNELTKQSQDLTDLIEMIRTDLDNQTRKKINVLIILDVHARDIVDRFVRDSILSDKEFDWESQLRFLWDRKKDDIVIRQCTGLFSYCYEYLGLSSRLVITQLTDRCVMTLTTALTFHLGGAPAGPAGTGKTETVKDLAKGLAIKCVVTNCGETLDALAMGSIFSGLIQTGFWGCFDEFNRINPEVLSVISTQLQQIQAGLAKGNKTRIEFQGADVRLISTVGIFVTMNPGYQGRSELPDNLKALFRPVTMIVPDLILICENMLMSEGFTMAKILAKKMTVLYKLAKEQLSQQKHYDFQLRALKSVLVMAGSLIREYSELPEDLVLMRALRDMNAPKFVFEDVPLFLGLINDLFPGIQLERVGYESMKEKIVNIMDQGKYKHDDEAVFNDQVNKIVQLYETMLTRHTTMVVGPTGAGKSVIINTLGEGLKAETGIPTVIETINSKSVTINELYGILDPDSRDWTDGILSKIFRELNEDLEENKPERRWIVYDGDVDAIWVENMNSVMDDSKLLTLANGERIRLQNHCKMLFEVFDLQHASPATISRCGMVYVDPKNLGYYPYYERWCKITAGDRDTLYESLKELYDKYVDLVVNRVYEGIISDDSDPVEPLKMTLQRSNLNCVQQLCTLINAILPVENAPQEFDQLEKLYIFCLIWSFGANLVSEDREKLDKFLKESSSILPPSSPYYDVELDINSQSWIPWERRKEEYIPPPDGKFSKILVPTEDTRKYSWLLERIMNIRKPCLFVGDSGTAKSVTINGKLKALDQESYVILNINFSSRTTSKICQSIIEENIDKRGGLKQFGPSGGRKLVVFVDDLHMPKVDTYGTQQPIAFLKFLIERDMMYERGGDLDIKKIVDTQYVGAMAPPSGGNANVDPRFLSLFTAFTLLPPTEKMIEDIYKSILEKHLQANDFAEEIYTTIPTKMARATILIFNQICEQLPRTPIKFHYIFNLRDLSRVYEGMCRTTTDKFQTKESLVRLWRNECLRVFCDRLVSNEDRQLVNETLIQKYVAELFPGTEEYVLADPILFGDYMMADPIDDDTEDPQLYEDLVDYANVRGKMDKMLEDYAYDNKPMNLVLFEDALSHLTNIHRIIKFPRGSALLVGVGGSGKQSLTKLASFTAGYRLNVINLVKNYKEDNFREDLKTLYREVVNKPITFLFTDAHVVEEGFLEFINNILTIGMVPALFPEEEKDGLINEVEDRARKEGIAESKEAKWDYFVNTCRDNLHMVLAMSPGGDTLRVRCRNFPGLVSNTSIDWFFPWPREALANVATHFLQEEDLEDSLRQPITDHIVMVHLSVQEASVKYEEEFKRRNFSTPKNYLDFINSYTSKLVHSKKDLDSKVHRLEGGCSTLEKASKETEELSKVLAEKNAKIKEKAEVVESLIKDITEKSEIAGEQQAIAVKKKEYLDVESVKIAKEEEEASKELAAAEPALQAAKEALKDVNKDDITEIRSLPQPPPLVQIVCTLTYYLYPFAKNLGSDDWATVKQVLLGDSKLLSVLQEYNIEKLKADPVRRAKTKMSELEKKAKCVGDPDELLTVIKTASKSAGGLYKWVKANLECYEIYKSVAPKRKRAAEMKAKLEQAEKELKETEANLAELNASIEALNKERELKQTELDGLKAESAKMQKRLDAATKLITGLSSEQKRWTNDMKTFEEDKVKLVGDCLLGCAFLSYCGPFNHIFRTRLVYEQWFDNVRDTGIPHKSDFRLEHLLTDDVEKAKWASEGLPGDELSVQNGILVSSMSRSPLCIDPQMQAVAWIKHKEVNNNLKILSFNQSDFMKHLENSIEYGYSVLFEGIDIEIDPMIDPVIEKDIQVQAGVKIIKLGDNDIEWNDDFKLFLTTKIGNPFYSPEIFGKAMIINFNVTREGLRDQLLNEVVGFERPELEEVRKKLVKETSENRATLKVLEDTLLSELSASTGPLVDNEPLIQVLDDAKTKVDEIGVALEEAKITNEDLEKNRDSYRDVAMRGAILFFAMSGLSNISEMYEYSLSSYLEVFKKSLETAKKDQILQNRLRNIMNTLTTRVYDFTCMGIFERHKLMFSFQMTCMILDEAGKMDHKEQEFFLKGNTSLEEVSRKKPYSWLSINGWKDLQKLQTMDKRWDNIVDDVESNGDAWHRWYDREAPEKHPLPCGYSKGLSTFQLLLVLRVFRTDRIYKVIKDFIIESMGSDHFVQPPTLQYSNVFNQSSENTPIVFILSPGADPLADMIKLADEKGMSQNKFKTLSLGQGMGDIAQNMIESSVFKGAWVLLQNCHLLTTWLRKLEAIIENIKNPDKNFRLWLTTAPTEAMPLGILQRSLKVTTEPPDGLRLNIKSSYSKLTDQDLNSCAHPEFKSLLYVLAFFHAVVQERRKFGKIGWNVIYDFNESDFRISYRLIGMYLTKATENSGDGIPWTTLRYLIGEAMYGGRVTDGFDRRIINCVLDEYLGDFIFDKNQKFFFSTADDYEYDVPNCETVDNYLEAIMEIPLNNSPEVFGLHPNAEIQYFNNATKEMWANLISMQVSSAVAAGGLNREEHIENITNGIIEQLPEILDLYKIKKRFEKPKPTQIVLLQELERYNILLEKMLETCTNLKRALNGEIGMSQELDDLAAAFFNGFLPSSWRKLCPQTEKSLVNWMDHLKKRDKQYKLWEDKKDDPKTMWLSGLHIPESYLTALVQTTCRRKGIALDKATLYTDVTKMTSPDEVKEKPEDGCYITGLYLEGARWNLEKNCLDYQNPKELVVEMPLVQVIPVQANKLKLRGTIKTPVYVTQARRDAAGVGLVFEADINTDMHPSHWILQGVAMVLNTD